MGSVFNAEKYGYTVVGKKDNKKCHFKINSEGKPETFDYNEFDYAPDWKVEGYILQDRYDAELGLEEVKRSTADDPSVSDLGIEKVWLDV